ncbi:hypothetical protein RF11_05088 [Thelohanellus kitauei]|uniref:Uncharacterized protein n=1 Tax=Thelohanellus kitauei TaxID=669202 RepID=A0A0C2MQD9_THEKT|nr:hypothetical protein RF11_05088 [Thelohanellus kitauei]
MASIKLILLSVISLLIVLGSPEGTSSGVSETVEFTADVAYKIITCLSAKNIGVCQTKPDMVQVKSCTESSVESGKNIPENVLDQIFNKLFTERVQTPAFQEELIIQMTHHLTEGLTLQNLDTYFCKQTVLATLSQSKLADTEYFEIFCSFKEIINVGLKYLQFVQSSYDDLKHFVEKHPQTDSELHDIKVNALKTKKKMLTVVLQSYNSFKFVFKPTLSHFITMLFFERAYEHDKLHEGIWDEIEKVLNQIQVFKNDPDANKKDIDSYSVFYNHQNLGPYFLYSCVFEFNGKN